MTKMGFRSNKFKNVDYSVCDQILQAVYHSLDHFFTRILIYMRKNFFYKIYANTQQEIRILT